MTAGLDGGATAAALGVSAGVTYDGTLTLLSGKRKGDALRQLCLVIRWKLQVLTMQVLQSQRTESEVGMHALMRTLHRRTCGTTELHVQLIVARCCRLLCKVAHSVNRKDITPGEVFNAVLLEYY